LDGLQRQGEGEKHEWVKDAYHYYAYGIDDAGGYGGWRWRWRKSPSHASIIINGSIIATSARRHERAQYIAARAASA